MNLFRGENREWETPSQEDYCSDYFRMNIFLKREGDGWTSTLKKGMPRFFLIRMISGLLKARSVRVFAQLKGHVLIFNLV